MKNPVFWYLALIIVQSIALYAFSRSGINLLTTLLRRVSGREGFVHALLAILFLPGTILHEMSHFFMATILFLKVHEIRILPHFEEGMLRLGAVTYEKKGILRSTLVGVAPFLGGIAFFLFLFAFKFFPQENIWLNLLFGYLVYTVSTTMFSSAQDLKDAVIVIPVLIVVVIMLYILGIRIDVAIQNPQTAATLTILFKQINFYLFISICINIGIILILKLITPRTPAAESI